MSGGPHGEQLHVGVGGHDAFPGLRKGGPAPRGHSVPSPEGVHIKRTLGIHRALDVIAAHESPMSITEIGEAIGVDQPRASRLVQALEAEGFVEKAPDPRDARRSIIVLTDLGRGHVKERMARKAAPVAVALESLTDAERTELSRLLEKLAAAWPRD